MARAGDHGLVTTSRVAHNSEPSWLGPFAPGTLTRAPMVYYRSPASAEAALSFFAQAFSRVVGVDISPALQALLSARPDLPIRHSSPAPDALSQTLTDLLSASSSTATPPPSTILAGLRYTLSLRARELQLTRPFDQLVAPQLLASRLVAHPYQLRVVHEVLREKAPAAILADEVGLGKTIEAALILKELIMRGLVRTALIVAPKALVLQWQDELRERFDERFALPDEQRFPGYSDSSQVICSFQQLVRAFDQIEPRQWDCLIVDEAHLLANPASKRRQCVARLRARWKLLLTATPVQNKVTDLYSLVDLARPGRMGALSQFVKTFVADQGTSRAVVPARLAELRSLTQEVMCRTRRNEAGIAFAARSVETCLVAPHAHEADMMRAVTSYLRALYGRTTAQQEPGAAHNEPERRRADPPSADRRTRARGTDLPARTRKLTEVNRGAVIREIVALQQSLSSSPHAIAASLRARAIRHPDEQAALELLADQCDRVSSAKEMLLSETLQRLGTEPVLIFTLRLETARLLRRLVTAGGRTAECYVGDLTNDQRRALTQRFNAGDLDILIATDAGAEGLNLQERCRVVVNYDLHWNPMKMEQRIGRVHRLGQTRDVVVANLALAGSIDEYVLTLLYQKIDLFTMTIGALESVLADVQDGELDVEARIVELLLRDEASAVHSSGDGSLRTGMEHLRHELTTAMSRLQDAESLTTEVLG